MAPSRLLAPPASRGWPWVGGARLTRRNGRPRERNPSLQRHFCPSRDNSIRKAPSKASSPLAHQFCVFLSSSSARCCPAVPEPLLEPSTWPGAVIIGVRALALAPYLEPRGVYFILVLSSRARRPRTTREVRASHPAPALACGPQARGSDSVVEVAPARLSRRASPTYFVGTPEVTSHQ